MVTQQPGLLSSNLQDTLFRTVSLQTPASRLSVFAALSVAIYLSPYQWLAHLSLWDRLGWHSAPSIGLTRAYWLIMHGHFMAAWHRNWLMYVVLLVGLPLLSRDLWAVKALRATKISQ